MYRNYHLVSLAPPQGCYLTGGRFHCLPHYLATSMLSVPSLQGSTEYSRYTQLYQREKAARSVPKLDRAFAKG